MALGADVGASRACTLRGHPSRTDAPGPSHPPQVPHRRASSDLYGSASVNMCIHAWPRNKCLIGQVNVSPHILNVSSKASEAAEPDVRRRKNLPYGKKCVRDYTQVQTRGWLDLDLGSRKGPGPLSLCFTGMYDWCGRTPDAFCAIV